MNGMEMAWLRRALRVRHGFETDQFFYQAVTEGLAENTRRLDNFIRAHPARSVHLVAHSLGGVLALQALRRFPNAKVARVVCLGSPLVDSIAARHMSRTGFGRTVVGRTLRDAVLEHPLRSSDPDHDVGVIGGRLPLGFGMLVADLEAPHDGVVTQQETELPGLTDHLMLPVSHFGLLLSRRTADQTAGFLRHGSFDRGG